MEYKNTLVLNQNQLLFFLEAKERGDIDLLPKYLLFYDNFFGLFVIILGDYDTFLMKFYLCFDVFRYLLNTFKNYLFKND